jgi:hypothetical protein
MEKSTLKILLKSRLIGKITIPRSNHFYLPD